MRRVSTEYLKTGDRIARDVYAVPDGLPLLRTGIRVSDSYREALLKAGIPSVWVDDGLSEGIEPVEIVRETTKRRATAAIRDAFKDVVSANGSGAVVTTGTLDEMQAVTELIVNDISESVHSAIAINDLANADGYTLKHSLAVTTMGLALGIRVMKKYGWLDAHGGLRFDSVEERLPPLGVGLLLHDIGKLAVPAEVLRKAGPLTDEEWRAMRQHPTLGVQILRKAAGISPLSRTVVRSHHERWNGSGYPDRLSGTAIHQFARVAAVADVYDALTSDRVYRAAMPVHKGWAHIVERSGVDFDPQVVDVFKTFVAPFPPGTCVRLSDGSRGIVKDVRQGFVETPLVRVVIDPQGAPLTGVEIDLSQTRGLTIADVDLELADATPQPV